ncbi:MAG: M16 family metallopeptidase, partial [Tepidisphaeraceae bacterium]
MSKVFHAFVLILVTGLLAGRALAEPLPTDPALVTGALDNGLRYIVRQHSVPPGRAVMWIHLDTGSLNETDRQRGIAHYLEHMAFNGSKNFPPGSLIPFFESLGMTFGRDQNAFTSFHQTTYQLSLPNTTPETLGKGMLFFADVVSNLSLLSAEVDNERQIILEERRRSLSGRQRTGDYVMERIAPGSLFGFRLPIGTEATIKGVQPQDFQDYYGKWYTPSNATLLVVADTDPQEVVKIIKQQFADAPKLPRPTPQDLKVTAYDRSFGIVASDPEIISEEVRISTLEPVHPPVTTVEQYRDELVLRLGESAWNRRLGDKVDNGGTSYLNARISSSDDARAIHSAEVSARSNPGNWQKALAEVGTELQRARAYGFTDRELDDVKKNMISGAERAVETAATTPAQGLISRMNGTIANQEPIMSPQQRLDLLSKLLPTITSEEVTARFAREFNFTNVAFIAVLPSGGSIPSESELVEIGTRALSVKPEKEVEVAHATELMKELPSGGKIVEVAEHDATKVWSG